jgi:hypothetical protein
MKQPVYHVYDLSYYYKADSVIDPEIPTKNRYVDLIHIHTKCTTDLKEYEWYSVVVFLQKYFLREQYNIYNPKLENIVPYFKHPKSLCSFYYDTIQYKNEADGSIVINNKHLKGIMTSRPVF